MDPTVWLWLNRHIRNLAPFSVTAFLVVLNAIALPVPGYATVTPNLALMCIYYWSIYRPDLLSYAAILILGLLHDTLVGAPAGLNTLIFLVAAGVVRSQRRLLLGKSFVVVWCGFAPLVLGAGIASWLLMCLLAGAIIGPTPGLFQSMLTLVLLPCVGWLLMRVQRAFLMQVPDAA